MKKVSSIRKSEISEKLILNDCESTMLRHLIRTKERVVDRAKALVAEADSDVSEYIRFVMKLRDLDPTEYGIALVDYKTITKLSKPVPTSDLPTPIPSTF